VVCGGCAAVNSGLPMETLIINATADGYHDQTNLSTGSPILRFGGDSSTHYDSFILFDLAIPEGATICDAYISFGGVAIDLGFTGTTICDVYCDKQQNPVAPTSVADMQGRTRTTATYKRHMNAYAHEPSDNDTNRTENMLDMVQEVYDTWTTHGCNSLLFLFEKDTGQNPLFTTGYIDSQSAASSGGLPPKLHLSYTLETVTELNLTVDGDGLFAAYTPAFNDSDNYLKIQAGHDDTITFYHFSNVGIPTGADVFLCSLEMQSVMQDSHCGGSELYLIDEDDSSVMINSVDAKSRPYTSASVQLFRDGWSEQTRRKDTNQNEILQSIVDRSGWSFGNSLQFVIDSSVNWTSQSGLAYSLDSATGKEPTLRIFYSKLPYNELPIGGVLVGGSAIPSGSQTETPLWRLCSQWRCCCLTCQTSCHCHWWCCCCWSQSCRFIHLH